MSRLPSRARGVVRRTVRDVRAGAQPAPPAPQPPQPPEAVATPPAEAPAPSVPEATPAERRRRRQQREAERTMPGESLDLMAHVEPRLVVEASPVLEVGTVVKLEGWIMIGRSPASDLVLDDPEEPLFDRREPLGPQQRTARAGRRDGDGRLCVGVRGALSRAQPRLGHDRRGVRVARARNFRIGRNADILPTRPRRREHSGSAWFITAMPVGSVEPGGGPNDRSDGVTHVLCDLLRKAT